MYLHDLKLCNDCWMVVDLSTNFCYVKFNYRMLSWVGIFCCCRAVFLEKPVMFDPYSKVVLPKILKFLWRKLD